MTRTDVDGLTDLEADIAAALWDKYADRGDGFPALDCRDDPRTVAHLLKPFLAQAWNEGATSATYSLSAVHHYAENPYDD